MTAAVSSTVAEAVAPFSSAFDIVLGDTLDAADQRHLFRRCTATAEVATWRMRNVIPAALAVDSAVIASTRWP